MQAWMGGTGQIVLCGEDTETTTHMFIHCCFTQQVWNQMCSFLKLINVWNLDTVEGLYQEMDPDLQKSPIIDYFHMLEHLDLQEQLYF